MASTDKASVSPGEVSAGGVAGGAVAARTSMGDVVRRFVGGDMFYSFRRSPAVVTAAVITLVIVLAAILAPFVAPHNPFDLKTLNLLDAFTPPSW